MNVKEYISSGIIESYVLGLASDAERQEFETICAQHPEIAEARRNFEDLLEHHLVTDGPAVNAPSFLKEEIAGKIRNAGSETESLESQQVGAPVRHSALWKWMAAASLILLAGTVYWAMQKDKQYRDQVARTEQLEKHLDSTSATIGELQEDINRLKHPMTMAALHSSDSRVLATVFWDTTSTSRDVYLMINNLPQPASDKQYQLWAILNGQPIDLGLIEVKQQRLLYRMKNVQNAEAFAISLEPKGGSIQPSAQPVALTRL